MESYSSGDFYILEKVSLSSFILIFCQIFFVRFSRGPPDRFSLYKARLCSLRLDQHSVGSVAMVG